MSDINCTHQCRHQLDGKCTLDRTTSVSQCIDDDFSIDCPYFETSLKEGYSHPKEYLK
ncbi:MAG TPA: hypothetical protein GXX16_05135 [Epulopiscium sp.]|nr:hypothetical protein [Candidatus Epulonipiscium sp.]